MVNVALVEYDDELTQFVASALYLYPLIVTGGDVNVNVAVVAPEYTPPLDTVAQFVPPSVDTCHV